jgi:hypothetical protein
VELENWISVRRVDTKKPSSPEANSQECSSEDSCTSTLTPPTLDDWIDVGGQGRSPVNNHSGNLQKTDRYNIELCESQVVDLLNTLYLTCPTASSSQPSYSDGRILLHHACKTLIEEKTGRTYSVNDVHIDEKDISESEKDDNLKPVAIPIIDASSPEITDRDIATLVFEWTTLDEFNGFSRVRLVQLSYSVIFLN